MADDDIAATMQALLDTLRKRRDAMNVLIEQAEGLQKMVLGFAADHPDVGISVQFGPGVGERRERAGRRTRPASGASPAMGSQSVVKPAIIAILKRHSPEAIHADQVVEELRRDGIPLSAKDPKATAVTAMIRLAHERRNLVTHGIGAEGVEAMGGNRFRWVRGPSSAPQPPSAQSPDAAPG